MTDARSPSDRAPSATGPSDDTPSGAPAVALTMVVATLGRVAQIERLFDSLAAQTFTDFEVIVVDQNDDDRLDALLARPWGFPLRHVRTPGERGASRGRNRGWRLGRGATVLFPDDDCWYAPDFLRSSLAAMDDRRADILAGRATDERGESINGRFKATAQRIDARNVWTTAIEWMVFFRRAVLDAVDGFDETVGIGAATPWQSCEIQDIIIRAMAQGYACWFDPDVIGHHEKMVNDRPDARVTRKARAYGRGMGFVLRLHGYGPLTIGTWVGRPLAGGVLAALRGRPRMLRFGSQVALGRLEGALRRTFDGTGDGPGGQANGPDGLPGA